MSKEKTLKRIKTIVYNINCGRLSKEEAMDKVIEILDLSVQTNKKFVERIEVMLYKTCGCNLNRGNIVLNECLKRNELLLKNKKIGKEENEN